MLAFEFKKKDKQFFSVPLMPFYVIQIKICSFILRNENILSLLINERELLQCNSDENYSYHNQIPKREAGKISAWFNVK